MASDQELHVRANAATCVCGRCVPRGVVPGVHDRTECVNWLSGRRPRRCLARFSRRRFSQGKRDISNSATLSQSPLHIVTGQSAPRRSPLICEADEAPATPAPAPASLSRTPRCTNPGSDQRLGNPLYALEPALEHGDHTRLAAQAPQHRRAPQGACQGTLSSVAMGGSWGRCGSNGSRWLRRETRADSGPTADGRRRIWGVTARASRGARAAGTGGYEACPNVGQCRRPRRAGGAFSARDADTTPWLRAALTRPGAARRGTRKRRTAHRRALACLLAHDEASAAGLRWPAPRPL